MAAIFSVCVVQFHEIKVKLVLKSRMVKVFVELQHGYYFQNCVSVGTNSQYISPQKNGMLQIKVLFPLFVNVAASRNGKGEHC